MFVELIEQNGFKWHHFEDLEAFRKAWRTLDCLAGDCDPAKRGLSEWAVGDCVADETPATFIDYAERNPRHLFLALNTNYYKRNPTCAGQNLGGSPPLRRFGELNLFVGEGWLISVHNGRVGTDGKPRHPSTTFDHVSKENARDPMDATCKILKFIGDRSSKELKKAIGDRNRIRDLEPAHPSLMAEIFETRSALREFHQTATAMKTLCEDLFKHVAATPALKGYSSEVKNAMNLYAREAHQVETHLDLLSSLLDLRVFQASVQTDKSAQKLTFLAAIASAVMIATGFYGMNISPAETGLWGSHSREAITLAVIVLTAVLSVIGYMLFKKRFGSHD